MNHWKRGWMLICIFLSLLARVGLAQVATTTVQDTVYRADGTPAGGTVVISWNAFTTAAGNAVPAGSTAVTIGSGGLLTVALAPNAGGSPMGSYYSVVYHLNDGSTSREYWVIPVIVPGGGTAKLAAVRNTVLPASVAMQTVTKNYVDTAIARALDGVHPEDASPYVEKAGDTMTGPLVLPGDPVTANQAADKNYVDTNVAAVAAGLARKVDELPGTTQVVAQPDGTELEVNHLNGTLYAKEYASTLGSDGVSNALASPDCAAGCDVHVDPDYTDAGPFGTLPLQARVTDFRGGKEGVAAQDPLSPLDNGTSVANDISIISTEPAATRKALFPSANALNNFGLTVNNFGLAGGNNHYPFVGSVPYFKSTYSGTQINGRYNTQGQHVLNANTQYCYGVGDCILGQLLLRASGGTRDNSDEGAHPFDFDIAEDDAVFRGTCATGCTTGSTIVTIAATNDGGSQGEGRYLINKNPAKTITAGTLTGGARTAPFASAYFTGTSFPSSVFLTTAADAVSQPANIAPGTVTLPIATSGVASGFSTNTAALPGSGVACIADPHGPGATSIGNFEMANYNVVDGTHIQLTLNKTHAAGAMVSVGGLCGYGLEQTVDTVGAIRQVFPVMGASSSTALYYVDDRTAIVGAFGSTSGYMNLTSSIASISRTGNVATVNVADFIPDVTGLTITVSGVADSSYNGNYTVSSTGTHSFTYSNTGANSTSSGGTISKLTGGYVLYPMAEVLSVMDPATKTVNGYMLLGANKVAWAPGDVVEQPHYWQEEVANQMDRFTQFTPRPQGAERGGMQYNGTVGPGIRGWTVSNAADPGSYLGNGGTHSLPDAAYEVLGPWNTTLTGQAPDQAVIQLTCNSHGCNKYDSSYALFLLQSATGTDELLYSPQSSTATWGIGGNVFTFGPSGFTAGTINVGTLNASTITGGVSASAITSGTISPARLPVFGPSGTTHSVGAVPDPGATAGSTRYLREDGTWSTPGGSGTGYTLMFRPNSFSLVAATTRYMGYFGVSSNSGTAQNSEFVVTPKAGAIKSIEASLDTGAGGSIGNSVSLVLYDLTTSTTLYTMSIADPVFATADTYASGLNISVAAGDQLQARLTSPTGSTTRAVNVGVVLYIE